jgi:glycosyltransferase involved in cell wall biosynthesis
MRILVVTPTYFPIIGGAEIGIYQIYTKLVERHQVRVLTPELRGRVARRFGDALPDGFNIELETVRFKDTWSTMNIRGHRATLGIIPPFSLSYIPQLKKQIREFSPDVINLHYAVPGGLAAVISQRFWGVPVVLSLIGRDVPGPQTPPLWRYYLRSVASRCSSTLFVSDYCRREVFGTRYPDNAKVVPYGADVQKHQAVVNKAEIKKKFDLPEDSMLFLAVQRLAPEKRVGVVIQAMGKLASENPNVYLIVAGGGPCKDELTKLANSIIPKGKARLLGRVSDEDLTALYQAADAFVFHSCYETFGVVLAEAMAAGLPIVTVNNTAIPELVEHEKNGFLVPTFDHATMADAMKLLAQNPDMRAKMGQASRESAAKYDWQTIAEQYESALEEAVVSYRR